ncbi:MAG: hypothetical protein EA411_11910 [Saprospirales bacterium]|nr:MAG: hypothetical protein EA411_11910 [Saprospirales bacterium]
MKKRVHIFARIYFLLKKGKKSIALTVRLCSWLLFFTCFATANSTAQNVYEMQDLVVYDCEGIFTDSNEGAEEGQYAHNEDFTFTICVEGASEIIVVFDYFATEANFDVLSAFDGPDVNSPLIAELSGALQPPPTLLALSGCITFHFVSDENIAAIGWQASWSVEIDEPVPPDIQLSEEADCPMYSASFQVPGGIPCDQFNVENFSIVGPSSALVSGVSVLDCDDDTGLAENFELSFDPPPAVEGNYRLFFNGTLPDNCDNLHEIQTNYLFALESCPLHVEIYLPNGPSCAGDCVEIEASVYGGSGSYSYDWNFTDLDSERVEWCVETSTEITLLVSDQNGNNTGEASFIYDPLINPIFLNPLQSDTFCASRGDHFYQTEPAGGEFYSEIIPGGHRETGRYQFWRWRYEEPVNKDIITYFAPNDCSVTDTVFVKHIWSGQREAACLNADPWVVSGGFPEGGYWTGPHTDSSGLFTPEAEGSFVITYHAENGCSHNKRVDVGAELIMPDIDTICSSRRYFLEANIYGGRWYGPGIRNQINGRLDTWLVEPNQSHTYTYILQGCEAEIDIFIKELYAGGELTLCSSDSLLFLPATGDWSGPVSYIASENAFDISSLGPGTYDFTLNLGECEDVLTLHLTEVEVGTYSTSFFCPNDPIQPLWSFLWVHPWGGAVSGNGVVNEGGEWFFDPALAGSGEHYIHYENLGCVDSVWVVVGQPAEIPAYWFCDKNSPVTLTADPPGGSWSGPGFLDPAQGLFDPGLTGVGFHEVIYTDPLGCQTSAEIEVTEFEEVSIDGLDNRYCYIDSLIEIELAPAGGEFTINGESEEPAFTPSELGAGVHEFFYRRGEGECASSERIFVNVLNPLSIESGLDGDTICRGNQAALEVTATGGVGGLIYTWGGDLGFGNSQIAFPETSAWFKVKVEDNCSNPLVDSVYIHVNPHPDISYETGPAVCFDQLSHIEVTSSPSDDYTFYWFSDTIKEGPRLEAPPGIYTLRVVDESSGCTREYDLSIPGPGPLTANFSTIPNQACIDLINNRLEIINISYGYENIWLDFGEGSGIMDFTDQSLIDYEYTVPGDYSIVLYVENELGCRDTFSRDICVENTIRLFIPNAFSPNGDGNNDLLQLHGLGVDENLHWQIFDRHGARVFESYRKSDSWDGTFRSKDLPTGPYLLTASYKGTFSADEFQVEQILYLLR